MVRYFLSLIVLLVSVAFGATFNQPGYIYNGLGQPIEGVLVTDNEPLNPDSCRPCNSAYTNDTGKYIIKIPDPWYYFNTITFVKDLYVSKTVNTYTFHYRDTLEQNDTVNLSSTSFVYDGTPKAVTVASTTPTAGLSVNILYDTITSTSHFSSIAPTNAGSYAVRCSVTTRHYHCVDTKTLVITAAPVAVILSNLTATYNGTQKSITATTTPPGLTVGITYNGSSTAPIDAGSYTIQASINTPNYTGGASGTLVINKALATMTLNNLTMTYDGTPKNVTATTTPFGLTVGITYDGSSTAPTSAGIYSVTGTISNANYQGTASGTLVINKATATVTLGSLTATYNGSVKNVTASTTPAGLTVTLSYSSSPVNTGSYMVTGTINDANYTGSASGTLVISKATATVTLSNLTQLADGTAKLVTVTTMPNGITVGVTYNGSSTVPSAIGSYAVVATINDENYQGSANGTLAITAKVATVTLSSLVADYNGNPIVITATTVPTGLPVTITYNGSSTAPTNAGSYAVLATASNAEYQGSASGMLVISRVPQTITFGVLSDKAYNDGQFNLTATATSGLPVTYSSSNNSIALVAGSTVTIAGAGLDTITAIQNGGTNYLPAVSVPQSLRIIGKPVFTSPDSVAVKGGTAFSYKVVYQIPGNPLMHKDTILLKPTWLDDSLYDTDDSLYGTAPKVTRNDTVKIRVSAGNALDTLVLVLHIKTGTGMFVNPIATLKLTKERTVCDLLGRTIQKTTTPPTQNKISISSGFRIIKVKQKDKTEISKTSLVR